MGTHRVGLLTGGGDAPGLNAVIRAVVKHAVGGLNWQMVGSEDSFDGFLSDPRRMVQLSPVSCQGLLHRGGTMLGTTNRGDPFAYPSPDGGTVDRSAELAAAIREEGLEGLIVVGGDGTQRIASRLMQTHGIPVVGVPKTIDNDLSSTDFTFGFWSAVGVATEALDRLHTTAESHERVMILEVMGRDAGWIALYAGVAGGADCIALPELPYKVDRFIEKIQARRRRGRPFTLIVIAEGAQPERSTDLDGLPPGLPQGAGHRLGHLIRDRSDAEVRVTVLGHLQRGGGPIPFDRVLATRFGVHAVELVRAGHWGRMVRLKDGLVTSVPLEDAAGPARLVQTDHPLIETARAVGIELGADT